MTIAQRVINVAVSQVGTKEAPPYSNNVKYNTAYYGHEVDGSAYPWCMTFVWWVFKEAGASNLFYDGGKCAGCTTFMNWAKRSGQWITGGYQPGDVVLYNFDGDGYADHVGIVENVTSAGVVAIEGNTSANGSQDNGGEVMRKVRPWSVIEGAWRPLYSDSIASTESGMFSISNLSMIRKGSEGSEVKAMQTLLIGYGYSCGGCGADGVCGVDTVAAIKNYQSANCLEVDGICGPETWSKLLGVR